jgi:hypothetical protein
VIAHWDDDDWYGPERLLRQVGPIAAGRADVTGLRNRYTLDVTDGTFWTTTDGLHRRMFVGDVHGGTLAYRRSLLAPGIRYQDINLAEDAGLLTLLLRRGARLERVANDGVFVYVRHGRNAWRFDAGTFVDPTGWSRTHGPSSMPSATVERYRSLAGSRAGVMKAPTPAIHRDEWHTDCLGHCDVLAPKTPYRFDRCVAFVATESYARLLDGALKSLARFGALDGVPRVVFVEESGEKCASIAAGHGAVILRCRPRPGPAPSIKGVQYSMARFVEAKQYLCLDADVLVLDSLAPLFEEHGRLPAGRVLVAPEATEEPVATLREALWSVYRATPREVDSLLNPVAPASLDAPATNDGVFVADRASLSAVDGILRGDRALTAWVKARPDVWWRQKAAFNVALARMGACVLLDGGYNAQLHVAPAVRRVVQGRVCAEWRGAVARLLHFNGRGKEAYASWSDVLATA